MPSTLKGFGGLLCMLCSCVLAGGGEGGERTAGRGADGGARSLASKGEVTVATKLSFHKLYQIFLSPPER